MLLAWLVAACGGASSGYPYASEPDPRRREYVIGASDVLSIRVWKNPDLNTDIAVRPDGTITMPLVGEIHAEGRRPSELRQAIADALSLYVKDPAAIVTVAVVTVNSYRVTVSGSVVHPGVMQAARYLTVSEAVALAGGPTRFASPNDTMIIRRNSGGTARRIPVHYLDLVAGRRLEEDLVLLAGDQVYVP